MAQRHGRTGRRGRWRPGARLPPGLWRLGRGGGVLAFWTLEARVGVGWGWNRNAETLELLSYIQLA